MRLIKPKNLPVTPRLRANRPAELPKTIACAKFQPPLSLCGAAESTRRRFQSDEPFCAWDVQFNYPQVGILLVSTR